MSAVGCSGGGSRIGGLVFANALPFQFGFEPEPALFTPSDAYEAFRSGSLDAALLPLPAAFEFSDRASVLPGFCIASEGEVFSVVLAHRCPREHIRSVVLDPSSRASVLLLRILLAEFSLLGNQAISLESAPDATQTGTSARLLIGDPAISFRSQAGADWQFIDLAAEWTARTGVPFVFAVWMVSDDFSDIANFSERLRMVLEQNLTHREPWMPAQMIRGFSWKRYFDSLKFRMSPSEIQGIRRFRDLAVKHDLLPDRADVRFSFAPPCVHAKAS